MKILIVGGTSSVGYSLKPVLSKFSGVITAGRNNCDIQLDLNDPSNSIIFPDHLDAVIHTAAHFGGRTDSEILEAENINVLGTLKLCQAAIRAKAKHFIFISSIFSTLREDAQQYNIYSISKRHAEDIARFYCSAHSLPLTILRPSQLYGNEESFRVHQPFLYTIIDKAGKGENIELYGSNDARRNYLHIDDLTQIIVRTIQNKIEGIYTCANTSDVTYSQLAKAAFSAFKKKAEVFFLKDKPDIPDNVFEKDDSLYDKIDFYPMISIEEGIKKLADNRSKVK